MKEAATAALTIAAIGLTGCGETTVIRERGGGGGGNNRQVENLRDRLEEERQDDQNQAPAPAPESEPEAASGSAPDVVGLSLPSAKRELRAAGFTADVQTGDAALGVLVPSNWTVCSQDEPQGTVVPIEADNEGC